MALHDIEFALVGDDTTAGHLSSLAYTVTSTPLDLLERLPVIRVQRIGGGEDRTNDNPRVSIQCFARATYVNPRAAFDLASAVHDQLHRDRLPVVVAGVRIDTAEKQSGPITIPWPTVEVSVVEMVYAFTIRH